MYQIATVVTMKIKTLVIAPYAGLVELTGSLIEELQQFDITVMQGDLSEALPMLDHIHKQGYDLLISRGGTARLLRRYSHLPVIDIQISGFDILRMLTLVKGYQTKIEMIGFPNIIEGFISVSSLMGMDISYTVIQHEDEVGEALRKAKSNGVKVIVGDNITVKKAAELAMQGILITSGRESVLSAFAQAKQIYMLSRQHNKTSRAYETLLNTMEIGYAIVDRQGRVQFANHRFRELAALDNRQESLYDQHPYFERLIHNLDKEITVDQKMMMFDPDGKFAVAGGEISDQEEDGIKHVYLKVRPADSVDCEIQISYSNTLESAFPQLMMTDNRLEGAEPGKGRFPMAVYGEKGVGKRLFSVKLLADEPHKADNTVELEIIKCSEPSFRALATLLSSADEEQIVYIRGADNLPLKNQKELAGIISDASCRVIFSFNEDPALLKEWKRLEGKLFDLFSDHVFFIPPLRERLNDMDEYIRTFLITYNERYGKQIVGLRPKVMEALHQHPWEENLFELRDLIDQFVKHSEGEYVEEDVLPLLHRHTQRRREKEEQANRALPGEIDLHKPLEEIEKDIIRFVLEQENMNQSSTAKRLGINRSTLWRKLRH